MNSKKVPKRQQCPNGERCAVTVGAWVSVPARHGSKPGEKAFWRGNRTRCSRDCLSEKFDREIKGHLGK